MIDPDDAEVVDDPPIRRQGRADADVQHLLRRLKPPRQPAIDVRALFETGGMQDEIRGGGSAPVT